MTTAIPQGVIQRFGVKSMFTRMGMVLALSAASAFGADWDSAAAAKYLDSRQEKWFAWPTAALNGGPCLSCHTGMTYMLARPVLRRALGETAPARWETGMLEGLKARVEEDNSALDHLGRAQVVLAALVLAIDDQRNGRGLSGETEAALRRMWSLQANGTLKGELPWAIGTLEPFAGGAAYMGASLAALAVAIAPGNYRSRPEIRGNLEALEDHLRNSASGQPLHHRLISLWASAKLKGLLTEAAAQQILKETWQGQEADGGWTLKALGPWKDHPQAPPQPGSNAYATALVALSVQEYGISREDPRLVKALNWLKAHQDSHDGAWAACVSLVTKFSSLKKCFRGRYHCCPMGAEIFDINPEDGAWGTIFYACHDPAVIVVQAQELVTFLSQIHLCATASRESMCSRPSYKRDRQRV